MSLSEFFNPEKKFTPAEENLSSTSKNSMYLGKSLKGIVYGTINNGKAVLN